MFRFIPSRMRRFSFGAALDLLRFAGHRLSQERLPQVAGSLTFTVLFAIVPMLTVAFAIFTAFPLFSTLRDSLNAYLIQSLMPQGVADTIMRYLNQFAAKSARLSAVGGGALVVTAVLMMSTIERVFNQIWRVRSNRPLLQRILLYWAFITLGPLALGASFSVTAYLFATATSVVSHLPLFGAAFYTLVSIVLTTAAFTFLYLAVPNRAVDWRDAIWGGLLAGIALELAKRGFAIYVTKFPTYTVVYGALAAVPIFLIWVYLFWMITLCGALLTAALPVVKYERWWHVATRGSTFLDAMAILKVLFDARVSGDTAVVDVHRIRARTRLGFDESEHLLQQMLEAGWVGRIEPDLPRQARWRQGLRLGRRSRPGRERWVLLANPAQLKLAEVYRLFVFGPNADSALARQVADAIERGLDQTLRDHFAATPELYPVDLAAPAAAASMTRI